MKRYGTFLILILLAILSIAWDSPIQNPVTVDQVGGVNITGVGGSTLNVGSGGTLDTAAFTPSTSYVPIGRKVYIAGVGYSLSGDITLSAVALSGTSGSTLNIGTGGTLGSAAYTNSNAYAVAGSYVPTTTKVYIGGVGYALSSDITLSAATVDGDAGAILNVGAGGTLGTAAYAASGDFQVAGSYVPATTKISFNGVDYVLSSDITLPTIGLTANVTDVVEGTITVGGCIQMNAAGTKLVTLADGCGSSSGGLVGLSAVAPIHTSGGTAPSLSCDTAGAYQPGCLSASDWTTFNAKQAALGYTAENTANKNAASGYAGLDAGGKVPYANISGKPTLSTVATSGAYADLTGKPSLAPVATTGAYSDLTGRPSLANVATSGAYTDLSGTPTISTVGSSGAYADLTGKPSLSTVATSGAYADLTGKPSLATVATSGSYNDLTDKPTITLAGRLIKTTILTIGSGTFTTQSTTGTVEVEMVGPGGGGGGAKSGSSYCKAGGGGGSGSLARFTASVTGSTGYSYIVTDGGAGGSTSGSGGSTSTGTSITIGGTSYLVYGGTGGAGDTDVSAAHKISDGGYGGDNPPYGDIRAIGTGGGYGLRINTLKCIGGLGAPSPYGANRLALSISASGGNNQGGLGVGYGAGGGGGASSDSSGAAGGKGAPGAIIIKEYSVSE